MPPKLLADPPCVAVPGHTTLRLLDGTAEAVDLFCGDKRLGPLDTHAKVVIEKGSGVGYFDYRAITKGDSEIARCRVFTFRITADRPAVKVPGFVTISVSGCSGGVVKLFIDNVSLSLCDNSIIVRLDSTPNCGYVDLCAALHDGTRLVICRIYVVHAVHAEWWYSHWWLNGGKLHSEGAAKVIRLNYDLWKVGYNPETADKHYSFVAAVNAAYGGNVLTSADEEARQRELWAFLKSKDRNRNSDNKGPILDERWIKLIKREGWQVRPEDVFDLAYEEALKSGYRLAKANDAVFNEWFGIILKRVVRKLWTNLVNSGITELLDKIGLNKQSMHTFTVEGNGEINSIIEEHLAEASPYDRTDVPDLFSLEFGAIRGFVEACRVNRNNPSFGGVGSELVNNAKTELVDTFNLELTHDSDAINEFIVEVESKINKKLFDTIDCRIWLFGQERMTLRLNREKRVVEYRFAHQVFLLMDDIWQAHQHRTTQGKVKSSGKLLVLTLAAILHEYTQQPRFNTATNSLASGPIFLYFIAKFHGLRHLARCLIATERLEKLQGRSTSSEWPIRDLREVLQKADLTMNMSKKLKTCLTDSCNSLSASLRVGNPLPVELTCRRLLLIWLWIAIQDDYQGPESEATKCEHNWINADDITIGTAENNGLCQEIEKLYCSLFEAKKRTEPSQ